MGSHHKYSSKWVIKYKNQRVYNKRIIKKRCFTIIIYIKKRNNLHFIPNNILTNFFKELTKYKKRLSIVFKLYIVGLKDLASLTHFISSPRPTPRKKKRPRMSKEGPSCWESSPRTILSSANQGHEKRKQHTPKDSPPSRPKQKDQHSRTAMGAWWRSNSRKGCHIRIKCPQLTV